MKQVETKNLYFSRSSIRGPEHRVPLSSDIIWLSHFFCPLETFTGDREIGSIPQSIFYHKCSRKFPSLIRFFKYAKSFEVTHTQELYSQIQRWFISGLLYMLWKAVLQSTKLRNEATNVKMCVRPFINKDR